MKRSLIDTDIFSEILKGRNVHVSARARAYRDIFSRFTISAITVMEIVQGMRKKGRSAGMAHFMDLVDESEVLDFDRASAEIAGRIIGDLNRIGRTLGSADPMIAGIALHQGLELVTANTEHFQRIATLGYPLEITNWRDS